MKKPLHFLQRLMLFMVGSAVLGTATATSIPADSPLIPSGVSAGDSFQLLFVSSTKVQRDLIDGSDDAADNSTAAQWDVWINSVADSSSLTGFGALSWTAVVSTGVVDARDHAVVSEAVYRTDGAAVATGYADFWDASISNPILYDEDGALINTSGGSGSGRLVWTGSDSNGTAHSTYFLGNGTEAGRTGNSPSSSGSWIAQGTHERRGVDTSLRVYGLSEVLTVVPEPSTFVLFGIGSWLLMRRLRRLRG